jgi:hypothetical protein
VPPVGRGKGMWVFCCGMYRSASTLQFQITTRLVKDANLGQQVGWIDAKRFVETREQYNSINGFQVIKVHICTDAIAAEFAQGNAIGIYISRDIRDVYASYLKQRQKPFDYLWQEGFVEECLENYKTWTHLPNVLVSQYEDVMADLPNEVQRIAQHLNISIDWSQCQNIAAEYGISQQQQRIQQFKEELLKTSLNPQDQREIVDHYDEKTLLHINHIDSAKMGRWQDDLTEQEVGLIEEKVKEWCRVNGDKPTTFLRQSQKQIGNRLLESSRSSII